MPASSTVRPPAVAGLFYPFDRDDLDRTVSSLLAESPQEAVEGEIVGVVAPHAGYMYSGPTAAAAYRHLQGRKFSTVIVVSPSHREYFDGVSVYSGDAYRTPLGMIPINKSLRDQLVSICPLVKVSQHGHRDEHAIEVQLPFLQKTLAKFSLIPLVIGNQSAEVSFGLGEALGRVAGNGEILLVASTDLSHYYPSQVADELDRVIVEDIEQMDNQLLMRHLEEGKTEACGGGAAVALLTALRARGTACVRVMQHTNSGEVTGDRRSVVGYLSAVAFLPA